MLKVSFIPLSRLTDNAMPAEYRENAEGFLRFAPAKLDQPSSEYWRDPATNGGESVIYTRIRETIHPYGFTFKAPSGMTASPTDAQLAAKANWSLAYDAKTVPFVVANVQL